MDTQTQPETSASTSTTTSRLGLVVKHVHNWLELYWWLPMSILGVIGAAKLFFFLTGRPTSEDPNWIVGFAERSVALIVIILFLSVTREQTSHWFNKAEEFELQKLHWSRGALDKIKTIVYALIAAYILLH